MQKNEGGANKHVANHKLSDRKLMAELYCKSVMKPIGGNIFVNTLVESVACMPHTDKKCNSIDNNCIPHDSWLKELGMEIGSSGNYDKIVWLTNWYTNDYGRTV